MCRPGRDVPCTVGRDDPPSATASVRPGWCHQQHVPSGGFGYRRRTCGHGAVADQGHQRFPQRLKGGQLLRPALGRCVVVPARQVAAATITDVTVFGSRARGSVEVNFPRVVEGCESQLSENPNVGLLGQGWVF